MPAETRDYVPKLQAIKNIVARPHDFGLDLPALKNHPYFLSVPIERDIDVDLAARLAGLPLDEFHQLDAQMNKPVILAAGTPQVLLPYDNANAFVRALGRHAGPLASWNLSDGAAHAARLRGCTHDGCERRATARSQPDSCPDARQGWLRRRCSFRARQLMTRMSRKRWPTTRPWLLLLSVANCERSPSMPDGGATP